MTKKITIANLYHDIHVSHKAITIKIRSFSKKQSSSLFKTTYIAYLIQTSNGWSVYRRFNDFSWLYRYYKDMYQGLPVIIK